jgi:RNA polymerase sigma factor (sigma-70 family)
VAGRFRGFLEKLLGSRHRDAATEVASDTELLRRFAMDGDQEAFELLVWRHGLMVLGICQRLVRDEHLAEDAFQAVFLVLAKKARTIRGDNVAGWLFRVARRVTARADQHRLRVQQLPEIAVESAVNPFEQEELSKLLDAEVARLPERLRRPVLLCYLGGRSTEDAARCRERAWLSARHNPFPTLSSAKAIG